eukprot:754020-Hanusia_phi.AAC.1
MAERGSDLDGMSSHSSSTMGRNGHYSLRKPGPEPANWLTSLSATERAKFSGIHDGDWDYFVDVMLTKTFVEKLEAHVRKSSRQLPKETMDKYVSRFRSMTTHLTACYQMLKKPGVTVGILEYLFVDGISSEATSHY